MAAKGNYPQIILSGTDPELPPELPTGIAKYSDFKIMTRGGKTTLYSCWDGIVGRTVALKKLEAEWAEDPRERRRFLREARITAQLQHPNTVPVYEIGWAHQSLYFTMKRIAGENFFRVLQRLSWGDRETVRRWPLDSLIDVIIQVALALAYAHVRGVIHRDVKPENIWLGDYGEVVLLDWGVAKVWGGEDDAALGPPPPTVITAGEFAPLSLTRTGQRPGTPLYMSPEQVLGHHYVDERTDMFSLGVVLYEALTLTEPFRGRTVDETFERIIHEAPPPPHELRPDRDIPEAVEAIAMKAIAKEPADRYESMLEMVEALRRARRHVVAG